VGAGEDDPAVEATRKRQSEIAEADQKADEDLDLTDEDEDE
jgi:hypothetical protein